jgi:hypothetical protein
VAGEADEASFSFFLRLQHRLGRTAGGVDALWIVGEGDLVNLPEIEVIGLQAA